jgi:hypothetical protein
MGVEAEWQNQEGEKNQSLSKKIVFIVNPGGHYAKPVFEDITLSLRTNIEKQNFLSHLKPFCSRFLLRRRNLINFFFG